MIAPKTRKQPEPKTDDARTGEKTPAFGRMFFLAIVGVLVVKILFLDVGWLRGSYLRLGQGIEFILHWRPDRLKPLEKECASDRGEGCFRLADFLVLNHHKTKALPYYETSCAHDFVTACDSVGILGGTTRIERAKQGCAEANPHECYIAGMDRYRAGDFPGAMNYLLRSCRLHYLPACLDYGNFIDSSSAEKVAPDCDGKAGSRENCAIFVGFLEKQERWKAHTLYYLKLFRSASLRENFTAGENEYGGLEGSLLLSRCARVNVKACSMLLGTLSRAWKWSHEDPGLARALLSGPDE